MVSETIKNVADQCHYPEVHLVDKGSIAVALMLSGAQKQSYILGYHRLARELSAYFHLKITGRLKAIKSLMTEIKLIMHRIALVALSHEAHHKNFDC